MTTSFHPHPSSSSPSCRLIIRIYEGTGLPILNILDNIYIQAAVGGIIHRTGPAINVPTTTTTSPSSSSSSSSSTVNHHRGGGGIPGTRNIQWNGQEGLLTWDISTHTLRKLVFASPKLRLSILSSTYSVIDNGSSSTKNGNSTVISSSPPRLTDAMGKKVMNHPEDVYLGHCILDLSSILPTVDGRNPWMDPNYVHNSQHHTTVMNTTDKNNGNNDYDTSTTDSQWIEIIGMNNAMVRMGAYITDTDKGAKKDYMDTLPDTHFISDPSILSSSSFQPSSVVQGSSSPTQPYTINNNNDNSSSSSSNISTKTIHPPVSTVSPLKNNLEYSSDRTTTPGNVASFSHSSSSSPSSTTTSVAESTTTMENNGTNKIIQAELSMNSEGIPVGHRGNTLYDVTITLQNMTMEWKKLLRQYTGPFWLSYKLFGVLVQTEAFTVPAVSSTDETMDNDETAFPTVSDTYTLRSCLPDIALFLTGMQPLYVYLCTPGVAIGVAEISFVHLLQAIPRIALPRYKNNQKMINIHKLSSSLNIDDLTAADPAECRNAFFLGSQMNGTFPFTQINGDKFSTDIALAIDVTLATRPAKEETTNGRTDSGKDTVPLIDTFVSSSASVPPYGKFSVPSSMSEVAPLPPSTVKLANMDDIKTAMVEMITSDTLLGLLPSGTANENNGGTENVPTIDGTDEEEQLPGGLLCLRALRLRLISMQITNETIGIMEHLTPTNRYPVNLVYQTLFYPPEEIYFELQIDHIDDAAQLLNETIACEVPVLTSDHRDTTATSFLGTEAKRIILHLPSRYIGPNGKEYSVTAPGDLLFKIVCNDTEYTARIPAATVCLLSSTAPTDNTYQFVSLALEDTSRNSIGVINLQIECTVTKESSDSSTVGPTESSTTTTKVNSSSVPVLPNTTVSPSSLATQQPPSTFDITTLTYEQLLRIPGAKQHIDSLIHSTIEKEEDALRHWRQAREEEWLANKARVETEIRRDAEERISSRLTALENSWTERENQLLSNVVRSSTTANVASLSTVVPSVNEQPVIPAGYINPANMTLDQLLSIPSAKLHIDGLLVNAKHKEEENLNTWRRAREDEWIANKLKAETEWRKEADEREQARMTVMEAAWADREAERTAVMVEAQDRVREVESKLRKLLSGAETKLREAEKAKEDVARQAESKMADINALQRRLREDTEHAMNNARQRETNANARVAEMTTEVETIRARCVQLETEAVEARKSALSAPDAALRDAMAAAQAECSNLRQALNVMTEEMDKERQAKEDARMQVLRLAKEVSKLRHELEASKQLDIERLRVTWLSREERYVLDGDRSALRDIRRAADTVRDQIQYSTNTNNKENWEENNSKQSNKGIPPVAGDEESRSNYQAPEKGNKISTDLREAAVNSILKDSVPPFVPMDSSVEGTSSSPVFAMVPTTENASQIINQLKMERKALLASDTGYTVSHPIIRRIDKALFAAEKAARGLTSTTKYSITPTGLV